MAQLTGTPHPVVLAPNVTLTAPDLTGTATLKPGAVVGGVTRGPEEATAAFLEALGNVDFHQSHQVVIDARERGARGTDGVRTTTGEQGMTLTVPAVSNDEAQVLLLVDERGIASWHLPDAAGPDDPNHAVRGGGTTSFTIPRRVAVEPVEETAGAQRGIITALGKKLLSVFVVKLLDKAAEFAANAVAKHYEDKHRPEGIRRLTSTGWLTPGADPFTTWDGVSDGPLLLFIHGTASSSHTALGGLQDNGTAGRSETLGRWLAAYDSRVFAFDHHTLSAGLTDNVGTFQSHWPNGERRVVDILTHSRGGLVARQLAKAMSGPDAPLQVRRIVYVSTPNAGTTLADPKRIRQWVNRMTTMLNLFPDGPWSVVTEVMSGVLTAVRVLATGAAGGLSGLRAMEPGGRVIRDLAVPDHVEQYAVSVEFEPTGRLLDWVRGADAAVDSLFDKSANDMVVPTGGVGVIEGRLDVPADRRLELGRSGTVWHCSMFKDQRVQDALIRWLVP